jgi:tetratricopeptide (TPR) repeat protein
MSSTATPSSTSTESSPTSSAQPPATPTGSPQEANHTDNEGNEVVQGSALLKSAGKKRLASDYAGALIDVNQAIEKSPNDEKAYEERARIKLAQKKFAEAITDCSRSLELKENPRALNVRGFAEIATKDLDGAIKDFNRSLEISQGTIVAANALKFRGHAKQLQGNDADAIDDFTASLKINPKAANAYGMRATSELKLKQMEKAKIDVNKALELNPKYTQAYLDRCYIRILAKDYKAGLEDANAAIESNPKLPLAYEYRGKVKASLGDNDGALIDISKAIELGNDSEELAELKKVIAGAVKSDAGEKRMMAKDSPHLDEQQRVKLTAAQTIEANNYVVGVQTHIKSFWKPVLYKTAHKPVILRFMIDPDGKIFDIQTHTSSGDIQYDLSAKTAATTAGTVKKPPPYLSSPVMIEMTFAEQIVTKKAP